MMCYTTVKENFIFKLTSKPRFSVVMGAGVCIGLLVSVAKEIGESDDTGDTGETDDTETVGRIEIAVG